MSATNTEPDPAEVAEVAEVADVGPRSDPAWAAIYAARCFPRSLKRFAEVAEAMATADRETAEDCAYVLKRGGRKITGPSVRLAEICASAWCNLDFGARIGREADKFVIAQGYAHDLETNIRCTFEVRRRITTAEGDRYGEDLIQQTVNAAQAIALRNAIFRVIPRAAVAPIFAAACRVAAGDQLTLEARRRAMVGYFTRLGVSLERITAAVGKASAEQITAEDLATLRGLANAVKDGLATLDDSFPDPTRPAPATSAEAGAGGDLF